MTSLALEPALTACYSGNAPRTVRKGCAVCGRTDLYLAHRDNGDGTFTGTELREWCDRHNTSMFVLVDRAGNVHDCGRLDAKPASPAKPDTSELARMLADQLAPVFASLMELRATAVDPDQVREIVAAELARQAPANVLRIDRPDRPAVTITGAHKMLPRLVAALARGRNVLMVGPAGSGKSTLAEQCAEALGVRFFDMSLSPDLGRHALTGYMSADGTFIPPALLEAFAYGGLYHLDEVDNGNPGLLATLNQILANGAMTFADGKRVKRHPDFYCMASGNTYGNGPDRIYVGRQALDGAFKNRFVVVTVDYDLDLEAAMCAATGAAGHYVTRVLAYVRALRQSAADKRMAVVMSPRNSVNMCELQQADWTQAECIDAAIRQGMSDQDWSKLTAGISF